MKNVLLSFPFLSLLASDSFSQQEVSENEKNLSVFFRNTFESLPEIVNAISYGDKMLTSENSSFAGESGVLDGAEDGIIHAGLTRNAVTEPL